MSESSLEKLNMYHHGTLRWQPTPRVLLQSAIADLASYRSRGALKEDQRRAKSVGANARHQGTARGTAFLTAHVSSAKTAADVLSAAIKGIAHGRRSNRVETLTVYQSLEALQDALRLAQESAENDRRAATDSARQQDGLAH